jgi:hypothetical protein
VKRTGRDEPIWVVIHICLETTQGIFLHLELAKMPCFSYYLLSVFFYKIREQAGKTGSVQRWRGKGRRWCK